jgi:hypothetical protein
VTEVADRFVRDDAGEFLRRSAGGDGGACRHAPLAACPCADRVDHGQRGPCTVRRARDAKRSSARRNLQPARVDKTRIAFSAHWDALLSCRGWLRESGRFAVGQHRPTPFILLSPDMKGPPLSATLVNQSSNPNEGDKTS